MFNPKELRALASTFYDSDYRIPTAGEIQQSIKNVREKNSKIINKKKVKDWFTMHCLNTRIT